MQAATKCFCLSEKLGTWTGPQSTTQYKVQYSALTQSTAQSPNEQEMQLGDIQGKMYKLVGGSNILCSEMKVGRWFVHVVSINFLHVPDITPGTGDAALQRQKRNLLLWSLQARDKKRAHKYTTTCKLLHNPNKTGYGPECDLG